MTEYFDPDYLEVVIEAVFNLLKSATFPAGLKFNKTERTITLPESVPSASQPALFLYQGALRIEQKTLHGPSKDLIAVVAIIYVRGDGVDKMVAAKRANYLVWGIKNVFNTAPPYQLQTLDGLVHHCWVEGDVMQEVMDQQVVIAIPINILPN